MKTFIAQFVDGKKFVHRCKSYMDFAKAFRTLFGTVPTSYPTPVKVTFI